MLFLEFSGGFGGLLAAVWAIVGGTMSAPYMFSAVSCKLPSFKQCGGELLRHAYALTLIDGRWRSLQGMLNFLFLSALRSPQDGEPQKSI